jgi:hypothetical protein
LESDSNEAISSGSEHNVAEGADKSNESRSQNKIWSKTQHPLNSGHDHSSSECLSVLKIHEEPHVNQELY